MVFAEKVYALCKKVPRGKVTTYKEIAHALDSQAYQAVGQVLRKNPYAPTVPCHRVVGVTGLLTGFKGERKGKEILEKISLLEQEGVVIVDGKVDLKKYLFCFSRKGKT
tara:strand:- start:409 stop:735 length:327 start_codon:yes stop_codon:yes gene_type:complete